MPTDAELLDLVVAARSSSFRLHVLDASLTYAGTVDALADTAATITNDTSRPIKRTMSGIRLPPDAAAAIDPFADRVQPVRVLSNGSEYPLGVFLFADWSRTPDTPDLGGQGGMVDQTLIVDDPIAASVTLARGASLSDFAANLLADAGLPAVDVQPSPLTAGKALTWPIGTSRLAIVKAVAELLGYYTLHFDAAGVARMIPVPDLAYADADLVYRAGGRVLHSTIVASDDAMNAPNRFIVIDTGATVAPLVGTWDVPGSAPHSYLARGFYATSITETQGLATQTDADAAAAAIGQAAGAGYAHLEFASPPDPRHDTYQLVEFDDVVWREESWTMPLAEGAAMTHKLRRVYR
jgi:hypothetical protein